MLTAVKISAGRSGQLDINLDMSGKAGISTEELPPSDWPVGRTVWTFLLIND